MHSSEAAAKHYVKISRFIPTKKTRPSTPSRLMGAGDFLAVRIPEPDKIWKFDVRRDLGIYLSDAGDTKRGYLVYMLSSGSVKVKADLLSWT